MSSSFLALARFATGPLELCHVYNTHMDYLCPSGKTRQRQKLGKGPENIGSAKIGKNRQNSANIKKYIIYSFFFKILNIFQYIKQQQHHINR
jgi:hypothetical protein